MLSFTSFPLKILKLLFRPGLRNSNFGRSDGWYIELDGEIIGELTDYRPEDMFWDSYKIIPKNDLSQEIVFQKDLWNACVFRFKNKANSTYVDGAFSSSEPITEGRVMMRGLYITHS